MLWTDKNLPNDRFCNASNPINLSNYMKYWTIFHHGGVFLDNDIEMVRPFDCSQKAFVGFQKTSEEKDCINTAVIGSERGNWFIGECLQRVDSFGGLHAWPVDLGCGTPTSVLYAHGMIGVNVEQVVDGVMVYAKDRFYPWGYQETPGMGLVTDRTFCIHHWQGSWLKT
jgi:hypothetical protein